MSATNRLTGNSGIRGCVSNIPLLFCLLFVVGVSTRAGADEWHFSDVERVIAISDVHGAYGAMLRTLQSAGVIDETQSWIAGDSHLVITGDLLDRGPDSRKVMDLVMLLEGQAAEQNGRVHQLLGNHEVMNLVGDLRYVSDAEYAAFTAEESADEREAWFQRFRASREDAADDALLRAEFADNAPPGFFGHRQAFRAQGIYGQWLLNKPLMIVIDGTAFVHGGVSPMVGELGLDGINVRLKNELREYVEKIAALNDAGALSPTANFYNHAKLLKIADIHSPELEAVAESVTALGKSDIHSPEGPLWYRGSVGCGPLIELDRLNVALQAVGADRVVIGHTPTLTRRVLQRLGGQVIEIDTGMLSSSYHGSGNALLIQGGALQVVNEASAERLSVTPHPRRVGPRSEDISAEDLERLLAHGEIIATREDILGRTIVDIRAESEILNAVFTRNPRARGFVPEVAAYRLDRALQLDMVPVTVVRELQGVAGSLQFLAAGTSDESSRRSLGQGGSAWCPLADQWQAMYIFDALIFNPGRPPQNMLYGSDNWQLMLVGHTSSFANKRGLPPYLEQVELNPGDTWQAALQALDDDTLTERFADVLDKRRINALAKRRDALQN